MVQSHHFFLRYTGEILDKINDEHLVLLDTNVIISNFTFKCPWLLNSTYNVEYELTWIVILSDAEKWPYGSKGHQELRPFSLRLCWRKKRKILTQVTHFLVCHVWDATRSVWHKILSANRCCTSDHRGFQTACKDCPISDDSNLKKRYKSKPPLLITERTNQQNIKESKWYWKNVKKYAQSGSHLYVCWANRMTFNKHRVMFSNTPNRVWTKWQQGHPLVCFAWSFAIKFYHCTPLVKETYKSCKNIHFGLTLALITCHQTVAGRELSGGAVPATLFNLCKDTPRRKQQNWGNCCITK